MNNTSIPIPKPKELSVPFLPITTPRGNCHVRKPLVPLPRRQPFNNHYNPNKIGNTNTNRSHQMRWDLPVPMEVDESIKRRYTSANPIPYNNHSAHTYSNAIHVERRRKEDTRKEMDLQFTLFTVSRCSFCWSFWKLVYHDTHEQNELCYKNSIVPLCMAKSPQRIKLRICSNIRIIP